MTPQKATQRPMVEYKDTLHLPQTAFEMRAGLAQKEPQMLQQWAQQKLYERILEARKNGPTFVLHDGPPYANGTLHHGHILNKVLKDMVVKDRTMAGFYAPYVPGWDCHGLPIEVQVDKELGRRKQSMDHGEFRAACRAYAQRFVTQQCDSFRRLGVLGRWDNPYLTMSHAYEAATLRQFAAFLQTGLVYKGLRPVNWCLVHQTALAEAEVEYEAHRSPSVYVAFAVLPGSGTLQLPDNVDLVIWTTTPWTLPANRAIAVHADLQYVAYPVAGRLRLVEESLLESFLAAVGGGAVDAKLIAGRYAGSSLAGLRTQHPFLPRESPVVCAAHVTAEAGTGCVHTAPAHGADDFALGRKHGLSLDSPVNNYGVLDDSAGPFAGKKVMAVNADIIAALAESKALLSPTDLTVDHRYPHCWRCHRPIIIRATEQWFVAMDKPFEVAAQGGHRALPAAGDAQSQTLRQRALAAVESLTWVPLWGQKRMQAMLKNRPDWCLSRQRLWGVPVAVVYCERCSQPVASPDLVRRVADVVEAQGADVWFSQPLEALCGKLVCAGCGHTGFRRETDILDVWFDSGVSFAAVVERENLARHKEGAQQQAPIDLVLEGSDQHRGWFQAALLCALTTRGQPAYKTVLTHGFVVDGSGKKISKSKGNFIDPAATIEKDGAELLRLWVAGEDHRDDVRLSKEIMTRLTDSYRKIRNTLRYLLGNLADFDPQQHLQTGPQLLELDAFMLGLHLRNVKRVRQAYETYAFHTGISALIDYCTVDLSAFYLDILKDRLYASQAGGTPRRSAQSVLYIIARDLLRLLAPIFCFTAEEAWAHLHKFPGDPSSVHLSLYPGVQLAAGAGVTHADPPSVVALCQSATEHFDALLLKYAPLREVRRVVNAALEEARRQKVVGASVQASVHLQLPIVLATALQPFSMVELADFFIVSAVRTTHSAQLDAVVVTVQPAPGSKCARCWLIRNDVGKHTAHVTLCGRCVEALT
jgi:isoleucyl-tRNA synthetase